ncbi:hypothetical protein GCM10010339_62740 [Streptomyces alanosinicus]|uniref:Uncharacterized protein n=1 Tax=Streptomyces alanosinicus TaxID=68171 RepID=A0A918YNH3_9ACTN|nr:hypothetical protein GCM10010339_62740 [Streptomyces alanosinicus]
MGGKIPLDPESLTWRNLDDLVTRKRYLDRAFMNRLEGTMKVSEAKVDDYDAIHLIGGHGVMFDFPQSDPGRCPRGRAGGRCYRDVGPGQCPLEGGTGRGRAGTVRPGPPRRGVP